LLVRLNVLECYNYWSAHTAGFLQLIFQSALVTTEYIQVATFLDAPGIESYGVPDHYQDPIHHIRLAYDPTPASIIQIPINIVARGVTERLSSELGFGVLSRLWIDDPAYPTKRNTAYTKTRQGYGGSWSDNVALDDGGRGVYPFVATVPSGADTGVLRYHAMRMNSSIKCKTVP
jgi:hypothetical protein